MDIKVVIYEKEDDFCIWCDKDIDTKEEKEEFRAYHIYDEKYECYFCCCKCRFNFYDENGMDLSNK